MLSLLMVQGSGPPGGWGVGYKGRLAGLQPLALRSLREARAGAAAVWSLSRLGKAAYPSHYVSST